MSYTVLDPIARAERVDVTAPEMLTTASINRVAVVDNHKANAALLLTELTARLERLGPFEKGVVVRKPQASVPAELEQLDMIAGDSTAALVGTAD